MSLSVTELFPDVAHVVLGLFGIHATAQSSTLSALQSPAVTATSQPVTDQTAKVQASVDAVNTLKAAIEQISGTSGTDMDKVKSAIQAAIAVFDDVQTIVTPTTSTPTPSGTPITSTTPHP